MIELAGIESFHIGGRSATVAGLPVAHRHMAPGAPARAVDPNGETVTGQMYVQVFRQRRSRFPVPLLLWHGGGMTGANWESTPDGRPGWLDAFLHRGWDVMVSDAVERGRAGFSRWPEIYADAPYWRTKREAWELFRIGKPGSWHADPARRAAYPHTRFPVPAFDAFAAQFVPRWAGHEAITSAAYRALLERVGGAAVIGHSQGGGFALHLAAAHPGLVRAVVGLEPSNAPAEPPAGVLPPHLAVWGDGFAGHTEWTGYRSRVDAYLRALAGRGVDAQALDLPKEGVTGNSHMLMMDDNAATLAARIGGWLEARI